MDSTQIASNIASVSHLQLLVEALQRVERIVSEADKARPTPKTALVITPTGPKARKRRT